MKCGTCGHDPEKIKLLKKQLEDLGQKVKESDIEYERTRKIIDMASSMDTTSKKNAEIHEKLVKERLASELDALQLRVDMIQKISPESADILKKALSDYEKSYRDLTNIKNTSSDVKAGELTVLEFLGFLFAFAGVTQKVGDMVKACSYSIRDTIKRIEQTDMNET